MGEIGSFVLLLALVCYMLWTGWPVTLWLVICAAFAWTVRKVSTILERGQQYEDHATTLKVGPVALSLRRKLSAATATALSDTALWVCVGLAVVWVAQIVLGIAGSFADVASVRAGEHMLASTKRALSCVLNPWIFLLALVACLIAVWLRVWRKAVTGLTAGRRWLSKLATVLTTINAFTFFSAQAEGVGEARWVLQRRDEVGAFVATQQGLLAVARAQERLSTLTLDQKRDVVEFLDAAYERPNGHEIVQREAEALAAPAGPLGDPRLAALRREPADREDAESSDPDEAAGTRCALWFHDPKHGTPSLDDVDRLERASKENEEKRREGEAAVVEGMKLAIGGLLPERLDPLLRTFVKSLIGGLVKTGVGTVISGGVRDLKSAEQFMHNREVVAGSNGRLPPDPWRWEMRSGLEGSGDSPAAMKERVSKVEASIKSEFDRTAGASVAGTREVPDPGSFHHNTEDESHGQGRPETRDPFKPLIERGLKIPKFDPMGPKIRKPSPTGPKIRKVDPLRGRGHKAPHMLP